MTREHLCVMALHFMDGIGPIHTRRILRFFGDAATFFDRGEADLLAGRKGTRLLSERLGRQSRERALEKAEREFLKVAESGQQVLILGTEGYPERLREIPDAPLVLFSSSDHDLNAKRVVAVVGTRKCTQRGLSWTRTFIRELAEADVLVISGLARGIDAMAHQAALDGGLETVAVCAHGLAHVYPPTHRNLAQGIQGQGALVSEFAWETRPHAKYFPRRNRIVAGMADAVVVVESHERGGSLITARLGMEYNREVFAVPGRTQDEASQGCLALIAQQRAQLVRSASDFCTLMQWEGAAVKPRTDRRFPAHWRPVLKALQEQQPLHIDDLRNQVPGGVLSTILLEMECDEVVKALPGSRYALR